LLAGWSSFIAAAPAEIPVEESLVIDISFGTKVVLLSMFMEARLLLWCAAVKIDRGIRFRLVRLQTKYRGG
jgi:hypothetical protein